MWQQGNIFRVKTIALVVSKYKLVYGEATYSLGIHHLLFFDFSKAMRICSVKFNAEIS